MIDHADNWIVLLMFCTLIPYASTQGQCGSRGQPPILTFRPSKIALNRNTPQVNMTITCKHPVRARGTARPTSLKMDRALRTSVSVTKVASADSTGLTNHLKAKGTGVKGSFKTSINFVVAQATCRDTEYFYECYSTALVAQTSVQCVAYGSLELASDSSDLQLVATPNSKLFKVGDLLTLTCSATVGVKGEAKPEAQWVWEVKENGGSWQLLKAHTRLDKLVRVNNDCLKVRYTVFKARLKGSDNGKTFRCYIIEDGKPLTNSAGKFNVQVDAFIFGLDTANGSVVVAGILIIVSAIIAALFFVARHFYRRNINREQAMYRERVMNRLDKLLRYEAHLLGGGLKKKRPEEPPAPAPALVPTNKESSVSCDL